MKKAIFFTLAIIIIAILVMSAINTTNATNSLSNTSASSDYVNTNSTGCKLIGTGTCQDWNNFVQSVEITTNTVESLVK
jgi:hypothetical protein